MFNLPFFPTIFWKPWLCLFESWVSVEGVPTQWEFLESTCRISLYFGHQLQPKTLKTPPLLMWEITYHLQSSLAFFPSLFGTFISNSKNYIKKLARLASPCPKKNMISHFLIYWTCTSLSLQNWSWVFCGLDMIPLGKSSQSSSSFRSSPSKSSTCSKSNVRLGFPLWAASKDCNLQS